MFRALRPAGILLFATLAALTMSGCPACDPPAAVQFTNIEPAPLTVAVTPPVDEVTVGGTRTFSAEVAGGVAVAPRTVSWSVQPAEGVVSLAASGNTVTVRGVRPGSATVTATHASGASATAQIRVFGG
jgi:uncharacterized protein YjdB